MPDPVMPNPYSTAIQNDPEHKRLITGRTDDLARLLDAFAVNHSVALFGERRIGKTSLLFLLRDIVNGQVEHYRSSLIDDTLKHALDAMKAKLPPHCRAIYVALQEVSGSGQEALARTICTALQEEGLLHAPHAAGSSRAAQAVLSSPATTIPEVFHALQASPGNQRFVFLFDEMEGLQDLQEGRQIAGNLRSAIQTCPRICMVCAGAEGWYSQIKEKSSPLVNAVYPIYLTSPARFPIETHLVKGLLSAFLPPSYDSSEMVRTIMIWTESKPIYVQAACEAIVRKYGGGGQVPDDWAGVIEADVLEGQKRTLRDFYSGDNLDELTKSILALLANEPGLTAKRIAQKLGYSVKVTADKISDLVSLDKVSKQGAEYRIVGTLVETWGKQYRDVPAMKSPWPQWLKWAAVLVFLILALAVIPYTHPGLQTFSFPIPNGIVQVQLPSSVEPGETGQAIVSVQNTGSQPVGVTHIFLDSSGMDYQLNGTNELTFAGLAVGEKRSLEASYSTDPGIGFTPMIVTTQLLITREHTNLSTWETFSLTRRFFPLQQFWYIASGVFGGLALCLASLKSVLAFLKSKDE